MMTLSLLVKKNVRKSRNLVDLCLVWLIFVTFLLVLPMYSLPKESLKSFMNMAYLLLLMGLMLQDRFQTLTSLKSVVIGTKLLATNGCLPYPLGSSIVRHLPNVWNLSC
eukprot:Lithocolla_globosa_v1_NODE_7816_length_898_cov_3.417556.p2 type:complete len:109 gc:universal NODE_7816_length_898_cov_3.417556:198-524(+)